MAIYKHGPRPPFAAPKVKGHLDYMRQMDTILVAVGVPTKEVPGASFALPQPLTDTKGTEDVPDQGPETQNPAETRRESSEGTEEAVEKEEMGDGWDIPDISDLLDSLNEAEAETGITAGKDPPPPSENNDANDVPALNDPCGCPEEVDPDNEQVSWSWEDTHWTTELTHEQRRTNVWGACYRTSCLPLISSSFHSIKAQKVLLQLEVKSTRINHYVLVQ